jgi:prephenate dehydratase
VAVEDHPVGYLDFEGHRDDQPVRDALAELAGYTNTLKVLGSFARAARAGAPGDQEGTVEM